MVPEKLEQVYAVKCNEIMSSFYPNREVWRSTITKNRVEC